MTRKQLVKRAAGKLRFTSEQRKWAERYVENVTEVSTWNESEMAKMSDKDLAMEILDIMNHLPDRFGYQ